MKARIKKLHLTHVYRQKNQLDAAALCRIRTGTQTEADLRRFNENVRRTPPLDATVLSVFNAEVDRLNNVMLGQVQGDEHVFTATRTGTFLKKRKHEQIYQEELTLRIGCRVLIRENGKYETPKREWDGVDSRTVEYVNGDTGLYRGLDSKERLIINLDKGNRRIRLPKSKVSDIRYAREDEIRERDDGSLGAVPISVQKTDGTYKQYPISLGYALTIAKSQGQTLNKVHLILPPTEWMEKVKPEGLIYVALSRCTDMNNVTISRPLEHTDIWAKEDLEIREGPQMELL